MTHPSFLLAIDTTGSRLNLGLDNFLGVQRYCSFPLGRALSTEMHEQLRDFVSPQTWQQLGCVAVVQGPGSYTGSRIGVVTARTLASSLSLPLYGFSSLAIAASISAHCPGRWAVDLVAQRDHVYGGIYQIQAITDVAMMLEAPRNLQETDWRLHLCQLSKAQPLNPLHHVSFVYDEVTSIALLKRMIAIAQRQWSERSPGHWEAVLPLYG